MVLGHVTALQMIQHIFNSYESIEKIDLKEDAVKIMGTTVRNPHPN